MKKMKKIIIIILIIVVVITAINIYNNRSIPPKKYNEKFEELPRTEPYVSYALNFSDPKILTDYYPYIFVAKVNNINHIEYRNPIKVELEPTGLLTKTIYEPYTIYDITVFNNLKGEIITNHNIRLEQYGGVSQDNKFLTFIGKNMSFLKENHYYIFFCYSPEDTDELAIFSSYNVVELGTLSDETIRNEVFEILEIQDFNTIKNLYKEKDIENNEINKIITYKYTSMSPIDIEMYKQMAASQGVISFEFFFPKKNISKYDVNYNTIESKK